jgi:putative ubiquitin-RnfH superfamily antitoxin RatB of RatAB toxin-antitoxin module
VSNFYRLIIAILIILPLNSLLAKDFSSVVDESKTINKLAVNSQSKIDDIANQIQDKLQTFKTLNKETDGLKVYNTQMESQIASQLEEMVRLNESIDQVTVIERQIAPLMIRMIDALEELVSFDIPFLPEERAQRLTSLNEMMARSDVAVSEKFRRVLEAYQVEVDYGKTIESYIGTAVIDEQSQSVNFLRIGRISLIYQSRDRNSMGIWSREKKQWLELDEQYRIQVKKGLRMAQKQLAPDMIIVPIPSPVAK